MKNFFIKKNTKKSGKSIATTMTFIFFVLILFFYQIISIQAVFNKQINYQGKLTTSAFVAVANGTYNMEFKLYDGSSSLLWTETRTGANKVQVTNGLFSVMLGEVNSLSGIDFNQTLYLGVNIGGTGAPAWDGEMSPRKKLGAVPAAVESDRASRSINLVGGNGTTLLGSIPYQSGTDTTTLLTPNITTVKKFFTMTGNGTNGAAPAWVGILDGDLPATLTGKTYNGLTLTALATGFTIAGGTTSKTLTVALDASVSGINTGDNAVNTLYSGLATSKQDTLVSGTNIKTINGASVLGSGDLIVTGGSGASPALSNLSGVAINTSLISDADNTDDLGSLAKAWNNTYTNKIFTNVIAPHSDSITALQINKADGTTNVLNVDTTNGYVGIGTSSPGTMLDVVGGMYNTGIKITSNSNFGAGLTILNTDTGGHEYNLFSTGSSNSGGAGIFKIYDSTANLNRFVIGPTGNVGIGIVNPTDKLEVDGNGYFDGSLETAGKIVTNDYLIINKDGSYGSLNINSYNDTPWQGSLVETYRSRGTAAINTAVVDDDTIGWSDYFGYDGADYQRVGQFNMVVDGTPSPGVVPGKFRIYTANNSGATTLRFTAYANDNISMANNGGKVGIGVESPSYKLDIFGTTATDGIRTTGGLDFNQVPTPSTLSTALVSSAGNVNNGTHYYSVTYITAIGETSFGENPTPITTDASHGQVTVTIPVSSDPRVTGRKIYRTKAGGSWWDNYYLDTISNNTATTYTDNIADSSLTTYVGENRVNTTNKFLTVNGNKALTIDGVGTYLGMSAGANVTSGSFNVFLGNYAGYNATTSSESVCIGSNSCSSALTGNANVFMGSTAGAATTSGGNNTGVGYYSLPNITTGYGNIALGYGSGRYIADGSTQNTTSNDSVYLGLNTRALADGDTNEIVLGYNATGNGSNTATIGNTSTIRTYLTGLNLKAGTATAGTAPLKLTSGTLLSNTEAGAVEFLADAYYGTITTGAGTAGARKQFAFTDSEMTSNLYIGTTSHSLNRTSAAEGLSGITGLTPGNNFTLTQNSVIALTSVESGAVVNSLYLKAGSVGIQNSNPGALLDIGTASSKLGTLRLEGNTSGYFQLQSAAAAGSITMVLPATAGTTGYQLSTTVSGSTATTSWTAQGSSLRWMKDNIQPYGDPQTALAKILDAKVYTFNYKPGMGTGDSDTTYVGILADEAPWVMQYEGTQISLVDVLGYMVLGTQATNKRIDDLSKIVTDNLSTQITTNESLFASVKELNLKVSELDEKIKTATLFSMMNDFFSGVVVNVTDGVAYMNDIVVGTLKVGSPARRTGITLYDEVTGDPYCLSISNGTTKTNPGECGVIEPPAQTEEVIAKDNPVVTSDENKTGENVASRGLEIIEGASPDMEFSIDTEPEISPAYDPTPVEPVQDLINPESKLPS